ncbi:Beauvericin cluster-specific repressor [Lachnellula subtilissima]|uniref:Beauvericin cluster-specific repressor n=1 Tax=Lachnellula subtilissima TaxID=602034 RepID=A0A8H8U763_9HELO|nr:Beauvericin cluster-specific repressor [Lachnellula subtilissima]
MATIEATSQTQAKNPRKAPKSRNGCLRCKSKRVLEPLPGLKCDEGKPECLQCNRKSLSCPGYKIKPFVWSTKHEKLLVSSSDAPLAAASQKPESPQDLLPPSPEEEMGPESCFVSPQPQDETDSTAENSMQSVPGVPGSSLIASGSRRDSNQTDSLSAIRQQLHRSTVPEFLLHLPTMLVEYYFNYVCQIFSSFDGTLNPFRSTVGRLWDGSAPIYYAIQSMAAAYLANHFPRMTPVGVQMQRETYKCLYQAQKGLQGQTENLDKTLLTVLLVGQTTAWHDPKDLGLVHLKTAKRLNKRRVEQQGIGVGTREQRQNEFFEQCILYWDMLAGFVEDDLEELGYADMSILESTTPSNEASSSASSAEKEKVFPHPWTGVAPKVQKLFAQVGRLIRNYRKTTAQDAASLDFFSLDFSFDMELPGGSGAEAIEKAQSLEEELLSFEPPSVSDLVDAGDENTPVHHYVLLAEVYRCAALIELYRVFPSILVRRFPVADTTFATSSPSPSPNLFHFFPVDNSLPPEEFLLSLALHTVSILEKLPLSSGTRCLQPIILIVAGSELRFDPLSTLNPSTSIFNSITNREVDIATARRFVTTRLQDYCKSLPAKPVKKALVLLEETWARLDAGLECFWMDVMQEMGLETIFG